MRRRSGLLAVVAAAVLTATTTTAFAATDIHGTITAPVVRDGRLTFTLSAAGLPEGAGLDPESVRVRVADVDVEATATPARTREFSVTSDVVLVVDTSGSMRGAGIRAARQAAGEFLAAVPASVRVGLVTFADQAHVVTRPRADRSPVTAALPGLRTGGETALFDALSVAAGTFRGKGSHRLVVISDGADTVSRTTLAQAAGSLQHRRVPVEVVGLHTAEADNRVLRVIARDTGGRFVLADDGAQLAAALRSSARSYATALTVRAAIPAGTTGDQRVDVAADSSVGRLQAARDVAFDVPPTTSASTTSDPRRFLLVGLVAIGLSVVIGAFALFGDDAIRRRRVRSLVGRYSTVPEPVHDSIFEASPVARTALELAGRVARARGLSDRLVLRLDRAAVSMTPSEWVLLQAGISLGIVMLFVLAGMSPIVAVVVGLVGAPFLGHLFLGVRASRRQAAFAAMLPDTLQLVAGSLSAGYSLAQAFDGVVREGSQPIAGEIGRALAESRLGVPVEQTLASVAERMDSEDFRWVVLAIQIQHQVGGNLAEVLLTVAGTMRERVQLRRHVKALSAEGRLSAYILLGLPVFLALYMLTVRREYIEPLYTTGIGLGMVGFGVVLMAIGTVVMRKMVKVEV